MITGTFQTRYTVRTADPTWLCRYDVEHDIRDVKVSLNTERIRVQSAEMFRKELLTSLVAYNLVIQFRHEAAERANVAPRCLSFTGIWNTFQSFVLKLSPATTPEDWTDRYERALEMGTKDLLRKRSGRSYPRRAHAPTKIHQVHESSTKKTKTKTVPVKNPPH